jgi:hypothetical protein
MVRLQDPEAVHQAVWIGVSIGVVLTVGLMALDMITVCYTTTDHRLQRKVD